MTKSSPTSILIVDDSDDVRAVVRTFLDREPAFTVCGEAGNGPEAIEKARQLNPDLVILDLKLPGMNGLETAAALRTLLPDAKLVLFSAYTEALGGRTFASAAGIDLIVPKGSLIDMAESLKSLASKSA